MAHDKPVFEPRISIITLGVADMQRAISFYRDGLGFATTADGDATWAIFTTGGVRLSLYPRDLLAKDITPDGDGAGSGFGGITLAHNTRTREGVDQVLRLAEQAGGRILKSASETGWGGYAGYFADLDGYPWEVAWAEDWQFAEDGTLWGGSLGQPAEAAGSSNATS